MNNSYNAIKVQIGKDKFVVVLPSGEKIVQRAERSDLERMKALLGKGLRYYILPNVEGINPPETVAEVEDSPLEDPKEVVLTDEEPEEVVEEVVEEVATEELPELPKPLKYMNKSELVSYAEELGVEIYSEYSKREIQVAIERAVERRGG